jgi:hypothetical protein
MKKLIVVLNDLEGCGNTAVARSLAHHLSHREIRYTSINTDEKDADEFFQGSYWDCEDELELSQMIAVLDSSEAVILDVSSGAARNWADFCQDEELDAVLAEMDVEMTIVLPEHPSERCHNEIADLAELFSDTADYVIAHLSLPAKRSAESTWKGSYAAKATNYLGALTVTLPEVPEDLATALESSDIELSQALGQLENLPRFLEVQLTQWIEKSNDAIEGAADYLVPEAAEVMAV